MSLYTALKVSTNALAVAQDGITSAANNIANINTPGYVKQKLLQESVVVNGVGYGAQIAGVSAQVDAELMRSIREQTSSLGSANVMDNYYQSIQRIYGQPGADNSISSVIDSFFSSYQDLSNNPETQSLRVTALGAAKDVVNKISTSAQELEDIRFSADKEISNNIANINVLLNDINNYNIEIAKYDENTSGYVNVMQNMLTSLSKLAEYLNVNTVFDAKGKVSISTGNGLSLLDDATRTKLEYTQITSANTLIEDGYINAIKIRILNLDGTESDTTINLTTAGSSSEITSTLTNGSIYSLLKIRDEVGPNLLEQLDTLASVITDKVNAIHNNGYGFPPLDSMTGTTLVSSSDEIDFTGSVRIAVLNSDGTPVASPYGDETNYRPLTLDLSTLNSGSGAGRSTLQTIMDEINDYFGPVQNRAVVGDLRNVRLAAVSSSITDAGTAQFDLEFDSISAIDSTVVVTAVTVIDPTDSSTGYTAATLPSPASYTVTAGARERTGIPLTVDFSGDNNRANYTVRVRLQVTDADGNVSVADVDYNVSDNVTNIKNERYNATAVTSVSGTSEFIVSPGATYYANASIVDADGNDITNGDSGYLKISTADGRDFALVIDELDSKEVGVPGASTDVITNRGFSHYFGLNNLFVANDELKGSAINIEVRSDIRDNANLLSTGKLTLSNQPNDSDSALYTYEAGSGNNLAAIAMAQLKQTSVFFSAAGNLPSVNTTLNNYSSDVIGSVASDTLYQANVKSTKDLGMDGLQTLFQKNSGVNSDEELGKVIELQNHFSASAQIINVVKQLFDILNQTLR